MFKSELVGLAWALSVLFATPLLFVSKLDESSQMCWMSFPERHHWLVGLIISIAFKHFDSWIISRGSNFLIVY